MAKTETGQQPRRVVVGKIDLDTCGAAYLLGVTRADMVIAVRGDATAKDLADPHTICIEVGGSGQVTQNNWDHHAADGPRASATKQVADENLGLIACCCGDRHWWTPLGEGEECSDSDAQYWVYLDPGSLGVSQPVTQLINYIDQLDTAGSEALRRSGKVGFPTLSDLFAGMLLTERDPVEQLHKGVELLREIVATGQNPYGTISGFDSYAEAKADNNRQIAKAVEQAEWTTTRGGHKLAILETDFFGAPGALYGVGAEVVVAYSPRFGNPPVPKFTIAGNGIVVNSALPELNALEEGWGGPATGTIIGSPRQGSKLSLAEVTEIVKRAC